ncbi:MAG: hypothetical protein ACRCWJ_11675 [Casimicrobium sp.]
MLTYNNEPAKKAMFQARFAAHVAADELVQREGAVTIDGRFRGCFIGCTMNAYDHEEFANQIGPLWLAKLADGIHETLPAQDVAEFGTDLLAAIPAGKNIDHVLPLFLAELVKRLHFGEKMRAKQDELVSILMKKGSGEAVGEESFIGLRNNFQNEFYSADAAAWAAAAAAAAAAEAAQSAAERRSAWHAEAKNQAADLIRLLRSCN